MPERITDHGTEANWAEIVDGEWTSGAVLSGSGSSYIRLINPHFSNPDGPGIDILDGAHDILISGGQGFNCGVTPGGVSGAVTVRNGGVVCNVTVDGFVDDEGKLHPFEVYNCLGTGLSAEGATDKGLYASHVTFKNCYVHDIFPRPGEGPGQETGMGVLFTAVRWGWARKNRVERCALSAVHADAKTQLPNPTEMQCRYMLFTGNVCGDTFDAPIQLEGALESAVIGNTLWGLHKDTTLGYRGLIICTAYAARNTIYGNILYGKTTGPAIISDEYSQGTSIDHNTIVCAGKSVSFEDSAASVGSSFTNNIYRDAWFGDSPDATFRRANNYRLAGPIDEANVFVKPAAYDLRLKPGSPCIGAGEGGSDIGAIPFEEESDVLTIREDVTVTVEKHLKIEQPVADGSVQTCETDANGTTLRVLRTYTISDEGELYEGGVLVEE